ncbi:MAG TPA: amidohydrolase [Gammaproteobacteria bacterium]|nr:amidohydrolase [Gammaproteobacteria bacterium]
MHAINRVASRLIWIFIVWATLLPGLQASEQPREWAASHMDELFSYYRKFHSKPELSFREVTTAARLTSAWRQCSYKVTTGIGGNGIVGILENGSGPVVMLRTDMDAIPVSEKSGLPFASTAYTVNDTGGDVSVSHACGHDIHMVNLIGVACYLETHKSQWKGTVMLVGQPAEEKGAGAKAMLEDGLFTRFRKPDFAIGLHVSPVLATGKIGYRSGYTKANVDSVEITMNGKGGHGAYPHTTIDPVVQAAQLVLSLQTIVSREVDPIDSAVVTIGSIHGGTKDNIIGDTVSLQLTVRTFSRKTRQRVLASIKRKSAAVAMGAGAPEPLVTIAEGTPSLFNNPELSARLRPVFINVVGSANVELSKPTMGGEDFSRYGRAGVPILMYWLGAVSPKRLDSYAASGETPPSLHSPFFYTDANETLLTGISTMASATLELLKP